MLSGLLTTKWKSKFKTKTKLKRCRELLVFGYLRLEIEVKYNSNEQKCKWFPNGIKSLCLQYMPHFLDSIILKDNEINDFLNKLEIQLNNISLTTSSFTLLYRSCTHGVLPQIFHKLCDDKGETITIIQNKNDYVFGGYSSISWKEQANTRGSRWESDKKAFLFNIRNKDNDGVTIYPICKEDIHHAIYRNNHYFPTFGDGSDIDMREDHCYCTVDKTYKIMDYKKFCGDRHWDLKEIEVFLLSHS